MYLNPGDAHDGLWQFLYGQREEQRDGELYCPVEGHGDEHSAGRDAVAEQSVDGEGDEDDDLAAGEEGGHVESS